MEKYILNMEKYVLNMDEKVRRRESKRDRVGGGVARNLSNASLQVFVFPIVKVFVFLYLYFCIAKLSL